MDKNNPYSLFDECNTAEESFSVDYADTYEKELHFADNNLNETILEKKIKESRKNVNIPNESFASFMQMEDLNALNEMEFDKLNITIQNKQKEDYLYVRKFPDYIRNGLQNIKNQVFPGINTIRNSISNINTNYTQFDNNKKVGPFTPLSYVIESTYLFKPENTNEMQKKYDRLKKDILYYRTIYADGNCYYRAIIYRYIELLILNKKIEIFKFLIIDIYYSFQSEEIKKRLYIGNDMLNPKLIIQIMIIILEHLENNRIAEAYKAFYDSLLFSKIFDYSLILYLRYIIYLYIKNNEKKLYSESFPVLIGNLLPSKYEKDGIFDFNSFYENFLLKMFQFAEKIVIYLTPFVLGIDLNVVLFDDNENEIVKKFGFAGKSQLNLVDNIYILNRKGHYENIYTIEDYQKYNFFYGAYRSEYKPHFVKEDFSLNLNNNNNSNNCKNNLNNNCTNNNYANNINNLNNNQNNNCVNNSNQKNNNYQNINWGNYNQYNSQNNQNNIMGTQIIDEFRTKTVINSNQNNNLRNMYFGNQTPNQNKNVNYNHQNQNNYYENNSNNYYYNNPNSTNNYYWSYTHNNTNYNQMNYNTYNPNNNYQANYYNQNNYYSQSNNYRRMNSFNQPQQTGNANINNYQGIYNNTNSKNYGPEEGFDSGKNIYYYSNNNNYEKDSSYFKQDNNIYSIANINNNNNNNNNYMSNSNYMINNNYSNNNIGNNATNRNNNQQGYNLNNNTMNSNNINDNPQRFNLNNNAMNSNNINNNPQGYNNYQQGGGQFKCSRCSSTLNRLSNNKSICSNCFIPEIIKQAKYSYIEYLKNVVKLEKANTITKNDFENLFLKNIIIKIDNKQYNIYQAIEELKQSNNSDFSRILDEILLQIKQKICLYCYCDVHNTEFKLPCGCNFCIVNHLDLLFKEKVKNRITYNFKCFCSYEYAPNKILELFVVLKNKKIINDYNTFIQTLNQLFCKICFECGQKKNNLLNVDIDGFIPNQFKHFICEDCYKNTDSNNVQCSICKIMHKYLLNDF